MNNLLPNILYSAYRIGYRDAEVTWESAPSAKEHLVAPDAALVVEEAFPAEVHVCITLKRITFM